MSTDGEVSRRRCVLVVHGVGEHKKSDTLLYIGSPLVDWILRWAHLFYGRPAAQVGRVALSFVPFDVGEGDRPPYAVLRLPGEEWYLAEAWWASSSFHPDLGTMLFWSFVHLFDILAQMVRATAERAHYLIRPRDSRISSQPSWWWQLVDLVNCVLLGMGYAVAALVGYVVLVPLMLLAQIPIESVQNFFVLRLLDPLLTANAGEFRMFLDDELQAANVRRKVGDAARQLLTVAGCEELIVLAHSEGCVVSLGMLTDPEYADVAARTRKLLTLGAGLNKSWLVKPQLDRLFVPLHGDVLWTDFWASYDPVPAGPLDPSPRRFPNGVKYSMTDLYKPTGEALAQVGPDEPPVNEQVTNSMNVITDHGGYFTNDEQVLLRLSAEISAPRHTESAFWPSAEVVFDGVRKRRERVSALALLRDIAVGFWAFFAFAPWVLGWIIGVSPWEPLGRIPSTIGPAGVLVGWLTVVRDALPPLLAPVSGLAATLLGLPALVGLAALLGAVVWAIYRLLQWRWWERWDRAARDAFLERVVRSSQERLRTNPPPGSPVSVGGLTYPASGT